MGIYIKNLVNWRAVVRSLLIDRGRSQTSTFGCILAARLRTTKHESATLQLIDNN